MMLRAIPYPVKSKTIVAPPEELSSIVLRDEEQEVVELMEVHAPEGAYMIWESVDIIVVFVRWDEEVVMVELRKGEREVGRIVVIIVIVWVERGAAEVDVVGVGVGVGVGVVDVGGVVEGDAGEDTPAESEFMIGVGDIGV